MWETVRTLRTIKNVLWGIIALIIIGLVFKKRNANTYSENYKDTSPVQTTETGNYNAFVSVDGGLNLRSEPNSNGDIIKSIPSSTRLFVTDFNGPTDTIEEEPGNWYRVKYKGTDGWVWGNFVTPTTN